MGQDISTTLDGLIDVLQNKLYNSGDIVPAYTGGLDIASKITYISELFKVIYNGTDSILKINLTQTGETTFDVTFSMNKNELIKYLFKEIEYPGGHAYVPKEYAPVVLIFNSYSYYPYLVIPVWDDEEGFECTCNFINIITGESKLRKIDIRFGFTLDGDISSQVTINNYELTLIN